MPALLCLAAREEAGYKSGIHTKVTMPPKAMIKMMSKLITPGLNRMRELLVVSFWCVDRKSPPLKWPRRPLLLSSSSRNLRKFMDETAFDVFALS
jgi:hypothetical protein